MEFSIKEEVLSESEETYMNESTFAQELETEVANDEIKPEDEISQNAQPWYGSGNSVNYDKLSKQCKVVLNKQDVAKHLQKEPIEIDSSAVKEISTSAVCIKEEDSDNDTIIDESIDSTNHSETASMIDEKFCTVDLDHIIPSTRKRKLVHTTLNENLDDLSDVTFSDDSTSSSSDTDPNWSPNESSPRNMISTSKRHRKKRRKTNTHAAKDENKSSDESTEKQATEKNVDFYVPNKAKFPFSVVSEGSGRDKKQERVKSTVRTILPKPVLLRCKLIPAKVKPSVLPSAVPATNHKNVDVKKWNEVPKIKASSTTVLQTPKEYPSTSSAQKQSVKNTAPILTKGVQPFSLIPLLPQSVLQQNQQNTPVRAQTPQNTIPGKVKNEPRPAGSKINQPMTMILQNNQQSAPMSQNNQPSPIIHTEVQPRNPVFQNQQQRAQMPQNSQLRPTILNDGSQRPLILQQVVNTIPSNAKSNPTILLSDQPRPHIIQNNQPRPAVLPNIQSESIFLPNNQAKPIILQNNQPKADIFNLPVAQHNILPQNVLAPNILPQNIVYIPQSADPNMLLVNPAMPSQMTPQQPPNIVLQALPGQNIVGGNVSVLPLNVASINMGTSSASNQSVVFQDCSRAQNIVLKEVTPWNLAEAMNTAKAGGTPLNLAPSSDALQSVASHSVTLNKVTQSNAMTNYGSMGKVPHINAASGNVTPSSASIDGCVSTVSTTPTLIDSPNLPSPCPPNIPQVATVPPETKASTSGSAQYTLYPCVPNTNTQVVSVPVTSTKTVTPDTYQKTFKNLVTTPRSIKPKPLLNEKHTTSPLHSTSHHFKLKAEGKTQPMPWSNPSTRLANLWGKYITIKGRNREKFYLCVACRKKRKDTMTAHRIADLDRIYDLFKMAGLFNDLQADNADRTLPYICVVCSTKLKLFQKYQLEYIKYYMELTDMKTMILKSFGLDTSQSNDWEANIMKPDSEKRADYPDFERAAKHFRNKKHLRPNQKYASLKTSHQIRNKYLRYTRRNVDLESSKNIAEKNDAEEASAGSRTTTDIPQNMTTLASDDQCKIKQSSKVKMKVPPRPRMLINRPPDKISALRDLMDKSRLKRAVQLSQTPPLAKLVEAASNVLLESESFKSYPTMTSMLEQRASTMPPSGVNASDSSIISIPSPGIVGVSESPIVATATAPPLDVGLMATLNPPFNIPLAPISPTTVKEQRDNLPPNTTEQSVVVFDPTKLVSQSIFTFCRTMGFRNNKPILAKRGIDKKGIHPTASVKSQLIKMRAAKSAECTSDVPPTPCIAEKDDSMKLPVVIAPSIDETRLITTMSTSPPIITMKSTPPVNLSVSENHTALSLHTDTPLVWSSQSVRTSVGDRMATVQYLPLVEPTGINEHVNVHGHNVKNTVEDEDIITDDAPASSDDEFTEMVDTSESSRSKGIDSDMTIQSGIVSNTSVHSGVDSDTTVKSSTDLFKTVKSDIDSNTTIQTEIDSNARVQSGIETNTSIQSGDDSNTSRVQSGIDSNTSVQSGIDSNTGVKPGIDSSTTVQSGIDTTTSVQSEMDSNASVKSRIDSDTTVRGGIESNTTVQSTIDPNTSVRTGIDSSIMVQSGIDTNTTIQSRIDLNTTTKPGFDSNKSAQSVIDSSVDMQLGIDPHTSIQLDADLSKTLLSETDSHSSETIEPKIKKDSNSGGNTQLEVEKLGKVQPSSSPVEPLDQDEVEFVVGEESYKVVKVVSDSNCTEQQVPGTGMPNQRCPTLTSENNSCQPQANQDLHHKSQSPIISKTTAQSPGTSLSSSVAPFCAFVTSNQPPSAGDSNIVKNTSNADFVSVGHKSPIERVAVNSLGKGKGAVINLAKKDKHVTVGYLEPVLSKPDSMKGIEPQSHQSLSEKQSVQKNVIPLKKYKPGPKSRVPRQRKAVTTGTKNSHVSPKSSVRPSGAVNKPLRPKLILPKPQNQPVIVTQKQPEAVNKPLRPKLILPKPPDRSPVPTISIDD